MVVLEVQRGDTNSSIVRPFCDSNTSRRSILNDAGNFLGSRLTDSLAAITLSGVNHFDAVFNRPDNGVLTTLSNFNVAADTLTVFAGGRALGGSLGVGAVLAVITSVAPKAL